METFLDCECQHKITYGLNKELLYPLTKSRICIYYFHLSSLSFTYKVHWLFCEPLSQSFHPSFFLI